MTVRPEMIALLVILVFAALLLFAIRTSRIQKPLLNRTPRSASFNSTSSPLINRTGRALNSSSGHGPSGYL